jgi:hypothetical protein
VLIPDPDGDELPDLDAARELARETVREMRRLPQIYGQWRKWRNNALVITDDDGNHLLTVPFSEP